MRHLALVAALAVAVGAGGLLDDAAAQGAQTGATPLGSVRLPRKVLANGKTLPAGAYVVRLVADEVKPGAVGQTPDRERWVEFVRGGQVRGREVASVIPDAEIAQVANGPRPGKGGVRVEMLKGNEYLRVWINRNGTNYLIHMPPA